MIRVNDSYATIQGEGAMTGTPMVLIRLQGCSVGCPWCDTKETWDVDEPSRIAVLPMVAPKDDPRHWADMEPEAVARVARMQGPGCRWAMITGGEPAEQKLAPLAHALHRYGFRNALETSGTALGHVGAAFDWVCVSPKLNMPGGLPVLADALATADEIKMVVGKTADLDAFAALIADHQRVFKRDVVLSLQPVSQNEKATALCVSACLAKGWRLSIQTHKQAGLR